MRIFLIILNLFSSINLHSNPQKNEIIALITSNEIIVDGIEDEIWLKADSVDNFIQYDPIFNSSPSERTVAKVLVDDDNIYFLIKAYVSKSKLVLNKGMRDQMTGDIVSVMLDTKDDKKTAYKFAVSASGVKMDCKILEDGRQRDYSWNGIWEAESKVYEWGYLVEMKIPFKTLMYDPTLDYWKIDFDRWIPDLREDIYWTEHQLNGGMRISNFRKLKFENFKPNKSGLNIELFPSFITKADYIIDKKYKFSYEPGFNAFINPSPSFSATLTVNPDFAQIEADPFNFNISRYESYLREARPFFTEGNEYFAASGKDNNINFYQPIEFFYSRRIGKSLKKNIVVPIDYGAKLFGNFFSYEYGALIAHTSEVSYKVDTLIYNEPAAFFSVARLKRNIFDNSSLGFLFAGKFTSQYENFVADFDGILRGDNSQFAYQFAQSSYNNKKDYAASAGFTQVSDNWTFALRARHIGNNFNISQIGFAPWIGTSELAVVGGPIFRYNNMLLKKLNIYVGGNIYYEELDKFADKNLFCGANFNFSNKFGFELSTEFGTQKDNSIKYDSYSGNFFFWISSFTEWNINAWINYSKSFNFARDYLGYLASSGFSFNYKASNSFKVGINYRTFIELDNNKNIDQIIYNGRPYISLTPFNNLNFYLYVDNTITSLTKKIEAARVGFLASYNYSTKSWIYVALNDGYSLNDNLKLDLNFRSSIIKINYLIYL